MTDRLESAIARIDATNAEDPNDELVDGEPQPKELVYGRRMSEWLQKIAPDASEALQLAARAQHIRRWAIPRSDFPMDKAGYYKWRTTLYGFHADTAAEILRDVGYDGDTIESVREMLLKKDLKKNPGAQTIEDCACLVFLQYHFPEFTQRDDVDEAKIIDILQKTWKKMSDRGHQAALTIDFPPEAANLVQQALA